MANFLGWDGSNSRRSAPRAPIISSSISTVCASIASLLLFISATAISLCANRLIPARAQKTQQLYHTTPNLARQALRRSRNVDARDVEKAERMQTWKSPVRNHDRDAKRQ